MHAQDAIALTTALRARDWPQAEVLLRPHAARPDAPVAILFNLGKVLLEQARPTEAADWLTRATARQPGHAGAWFELGRARLGTGDLAGAAEGFGQALRLDPDDADARRNLGRIALRLGDWDRAAACFAQATDDEALIARYRIACETGKDARGLRDQMLARADLRPQAIKALVRVARGSVPLRMPAQAR